LKIGIEITILEKRTDSLELISVMDIFILPSLNEGMSNALLEAMALKKMIIVSDIEENIELIENKKEGLVFTKGSIFRLAIVIEEIMESMHDLEKIKMNAFDKIKGMYNVEAIKNNFGIFLKNI